MAWTTVARGQTARYRWLEIFFFLANLFGRSEMFSLQDDFLSPGEVCIKPVAPQRQVEITLQDCLACSGCVTSAESVLILAQSTAELETRLAALASRNEVLVVSVAAEARASLAAHFDLSLPQTQARLETLFRGWGAARVLDLELARRVQMREMRHEFVRHVQQCRAAGVVPIGCAKVEL